MENIFLLVYKKFALWNMKSEKMKRQNLALHLLRFYDGTLAGLLFIVGFAGLLFSAVFADFPDA